MKISQVLEVLSHDSRVSARDIANSLDITEGKISNHIEKLRNAGFNIEVEEDSYKLVGVPEYSDLAVLYHLNRLGAQLEYDVEYKEKVGSTNEEASEMARRGADEGTVVLADVQTKGKGRRGRRWSSPPGGIWMSLVLRPSIPPNDASLLTLGASVAVARSLEALGLEPEIKWPNDVLIDGKKVCGILVELRADNGAIDYTIVGIGLNANNEVEDETWEATSLKNELGREVDRSKIVGKMLVEFEDLYTGISDRDKFLDEWKKRSTTVGRRVRVETTKEIIEGEALGVDSTGALRVRTQEGVRVINAGDCRHLR